MMMTSGVVEPGRERDEEDDDVVHSLGRIITHKSGSKESETKERSFFFFARIRRRRSFHFSLINYIRMSPPECPQTATFLGKDKKQSSSFLSPQGSVVTLLLLLLVPISYKTSFLFCFDSVSECSVRLLPPTSPMPYTPTTPSVCSGQR